MEEGCEDPSHLLVIAGDLSEDQCAALAIGALCNQKLNTPLQAEMFGSEISQPVVDGCCADTPRFRRRAMPFLQGVKTCGRRKHLIPLLQQRDIDSESHLLFAQNTVDASGTYPMIFAHVITNRCLQFVLLL